MAWSHRTLKHSLNIYIKIVKQHALKRRLPRRTKRSSDFCCFFNKKMEKKKGIREIYTTLQAREDWGIADVETSVTNSHSERELRGRRRNFRVSNSQFGVNRKRTAATALIPVCLMCEPTLSNSVFSVISFRPTEDLIAPIPLPKSF